MTPPPALPSATVLLVREATSSLEVFMVQRHQAIDFASGALVFPGGKVARSDGDETLLAFCRGDCPAPDRAYRIAAIREAFEESGLLLAYRRGEDRMLDGAAAAALHPWRDLLAGGQATMAEFAAAGELELALDALTPFAHWVTPEFMPKRFDTWFYAAAAPPSQIGAHDGGESVESLWIDPQEALERAERRQHTIVFATRMNLKKLARHRTLADLRTALAGERIITVTPQRDDSGPEPMLRIPAEAGYGVTEIPVSRVAG